jgi:COMPASS component SWD3
MVLHGHSRAVSQVRISPDGCWIASASADGSVRLWDASTGQHMDTLVGHMAGVSCLAWSPDSQTLASGSDDKAIRLWDRVTGRPKMTAKTTAIGGKKGEAVRPMAPLLGHHNYVHCLAFSRKGNILASGSYDEAVFLWDVRAGRLMRSLPAHSDPVTGIDFSPDGTLVVSCSTDGLM